MVNWKVQPHPLDDLEKLLVDLVEDSLEGIVANITSINKILKSVDMTSTSVEKTGGAQEGRLLVIQRIMERVNHCH